MTGVVAKLFKRALAVVAIGLAALVVLRAWQSQDGLPLELWHTHVPQELSADALARTDWAGYLAREAAVFDDVRAQVTQKLEPDARNAANRYFADSPLNAARFTQDWNRSFILEPAGAPIGAAVLLHGLTDSPYSLRHIAQHYRDKGWLAVVIRMPGHGTVPAALTAVEWQAWMEASRIAVREARKRAGPNVPLHIVGYSNGGALAVKYALDAIADTSLPRPDRLILFSPMIGVASAARFAGLFDVPALLPAFAKAAWIGIVPEYNPFKYNSFPVNGARQSSLLTRVVQAQVADYAASGQLARLPPVLTFQSVIDYTVSTRSIVDSLYAKLPANGSELVLFDVNRAATFGPLIPASEHTLLERLLPPTPRAFRTVIVTNARASSADVVAKMTPAGATHETAVDLGLRYPAEVFSLSHLALPFPMDDALYGMSPRRGEDYGVQLGALAARGERGLLVVSMDALARMTSNPFFPYVLSRIDETMRK